VSDRKEIFKPFQLLTKFWSMKKFSYRVFLTIFLLADLGKKCYYPFDFI